MAIKGFAGVTQAPAWLETVHRATGIDRTLLYGWVLAENGSWDKVDWANPLNVMRWSGAAPKTVPESAQRTAKILTGDARYAPIIAKARAGASVQEQIAAIAASPWDSCHYRGTLPGGACAAQPPGTLLRGTYERARKTAPEAPTSPAQVPGAAAGAVGDAAKGAASAAADTLVAGGREAGGWILSKAVLALAYVVLSAGALVLVVLGLARLGGVSARGLLPGLPGRRLATAGGPSSEIPF